MSPKYAERQSFAFQHCPQVGFRRVTWEQKVTKKSLSRCPGGRFCKTRRTQVFWSSGRSTGRILLPVAVRAAGTWGRSYSGMQILRNEMIGTAGAELAPPGK